MIGRHPTQNGSPRGRSMGSGESGADGTPAGPRRGSGARTGQTLESNEALQGRSARSRQHDRCRSRRGPRASIIRQSATMPPSQDSITASNSRRSVRRSSPARAGPASRRPAWRWCRAAQGPFLDPFPIRHLDADRFILHAPLRAARSARLTLGQVHKDLSCYRGKGPAAGRAYGESAADREKRARPYPPRKSRESGSEAEDVAPRSSPRLGSYGAAYRTRTCDPRITKACAGEVGNVGFPPIPASFFASKTTVPRDTQS